MAYKLVYPLNVKTGTHKFEHFYHATIRFDDISKQSRLPRLGEQYLRREEERERDREKERSIDR